MATIKELAAGLVTQRNRLASTLTNKGISASQTETFNTLIDKVNNLSYLTGWVTIFGGGQYDRTNGTISTYQCPIIKSTSRIRITFGSNTTKNIYYTVRYLDPDYPEECGENWLQHTYSALETGTHEYKNGDSIKIVKIYIRDGSFSISAGDDAYITDIRKVEVYL